MSDENLGGLGKGSDFVAPVPNLDLAKLSLSADELAAFKVIGRVAQIEAVLEGCGLPEGRAKVALLGLRMKGAITPARVQKQVNSAQDASMSEEVDLDEDRKRELLELDRKIDTADLFSLLGVPTTADGAAVKAAYYELSRKFHPDRYFGKNLGGFRARIDRIFRKLTQAQDTLTDDAKRAAYLRANPQLLPSRAAAEAPRPKTALEDARDAERRARLSKHPYLARASRLNELLTKAKANIAKGEWGQAYGDLNLASQIDERNEEVKKLLLEVRKKNDQARAAAEFKKGQQLEETNTAAALEAYRTAAAIDPHSAVANFHTARLMEEHGGEVKETSAFAQRAVDADPKSADARFLLARLLDTAGLKQLAKKHFDEGVKLSPNHPEAKKQGKRRWPF